MADGPFASAIENFWRLISTGGRTFTNISISGGTIAGVPGLGGVPAATVVLTDDQIKTLPTAAVTVVPAPGTNKYLVPLMYAIEIDRSAGPYSNVTTSDLTQDASKIRIAYGTFGPDALRPMPMEGIAGTHGTKRVGYGSGTYNVNDPAVALDQVYIPVFSFPFNGSDRLENLQISVCADNAGGNFTGGGAGNQIVVTVWYMTRTFLSPTN